MDILKLVGRTGKLFTSDVERHESELREKIAGGSFLVIGGAGSIGQAVVRELFKRGPRRLHVVDLSENNMVELVRDIRSSLGYIEGDFRTFAIDCGSREFEFFFRAEGPYDYVLNLSALKHVRSEKDPYTLMRMLRVNILHTDKTIGMAAEAGARKYFCVSTDKATNPVNLMGASKRVMEHFLMRRSLQLPISTARFANVAFSDGSLLHGFTLRMLKRQPLSAPRDVRRYFVVPQESGELCLMSCLLGGNRDIFFPKPSDELKLTTFSTIAENYLRMVGYEPHPCQSEDEARARVDELAARRKWPCWFFDSDTTGEKDFEEFHTDDQTLDLDRFEGVGVIKNEAAFDDAALTNFESAIQAMLERGAWTKAEIAERIAGLVPEFAHKDTGKHLDNRM